MINEPILTIAIPTFNRHHSLEKMLLSLTFPKNIEILVVDNCSSDGTWEWLCNKRDELGLSIKRNITNFGIEGNIIQALFNAQGKYIWLLSDHMELHASELTSFIKRLENGLEFSFGYARIAEYGSVLPKTYTPIQINKITQQSLGQSLFFVGNISAFIVNKKYLNQCGRSIFRFSGYSYPQLGVFLQANANDTFIELPTISNFYFDKTKPKRISYDTFRSRFIGHVRAIEEIRCLNSNFKYVKKGALNHKFISGSLVENSISTLCFDEKSAPKYSEFIFCFRHYFGVIKIFLFACILLSCLPDKIRLLTSKIFFKTLLPARYNRAKQSHENSFIAEFIKEQ